MPMLRDKIWPRLANYVTPKTTKIMGDGIDAFIDRNSDILLSLDLSKRYSFGDSERAIVYTAANISEDEMVQLIANSADVSKKNKIQSNPFYMTATLLTAYYLSKNDEKTAIRLLTYMSCQMYTSSHRGFYPYPPNEEIMRYTVNNLDNSYLIRQFPSLLSYLQDNIKTVINTYKTRFTHCSDKDLVWIIDAIWVRIKGKFKKIAQKYYDNHKSGRYLNADTDSYSDADYREIDNQSFAVSRLTDKVYIKMLNRQYERRFLRYSIENGTMSYQKLNSVLEDIIDSDGEDKRMRKLIGAIIDFYLTTSGKPISYIAKGDFIAYMRSAYGSNTEASAMVTIKETLDQWLTENMYKYGRAYYGKTVRITYRRALYMFFIFTVNYEAKVQ